MPSDAERIANEIIAYGSAIGLSSPRVRIRNVDNRSIDVEVSARDTHGFDVGLANYVVIQNGLDTHESILARILLVGKCLSLAVKKELVTIH